MADDHPAMLATVSGIISPRFHVVAAVGDGKAVLDAAARTKPDLALLDISMPGLDGIQTARELRRRHAEAKIVFLTCEAGDEFVHAALAAGAKGYVVKRRMQSDVLPALDLALRGQFFVSPYAFRPAARDVEGNHSLNFYLDEGVFFTHVAEVAYRSLARGEQVFAFLSRDGLTHVRRRLKSGGVDSVEAIRNRSFHAICVEQVLPMLMTDDSHTCVIFDAIRRGQLKALGVTDAMPFLTDTPTPDALRFAQFFWPYLRRAAILAEERGSRVTIISDLMSVLLKYGYRHESVLRVERVWNDLVPSHCCTVYCGCPVMHLSSYNNRETLVRICSEHNRVIPID